MSYPLHIDRRDGSKDLLQYLPPDTETCTLDFGDAMILGNGPDGVVTVGIEVKSVSDLLQSENTGRLAGHQLPGMLKLYDLCWLLYYGSYRPGSKGELQVRRGKLWQNFKIGTRPVPYGYLESFLMDVSSTGCRIKQVYNAEEAAAWLMVAHRWWSKQWKDHKGLRQFDMSKSDCLFPGLTDDQERVARAAMTLPGIGTEKAIKCAYFFDSISEMSVADVSDWEQVDGIGKVLAKEAVRAINGE